jgi:CSLREA domain-containing protein
MLSDASRTRVSVRAERLRVRVLVAALASGMMLSHSALAVPTLQVNSTADLVDDDTGDGVCHTSAGTCTLRAAVMQANAFAATGALIIVPAGTFTLTRPPVGADDDSNGDLNLTGTSGAGVTTIRGAGPSATFIDGNQIDRVFSIESYRHVVISGVTIENGLASFAGCIENQGDLSIDSSTVTNCYALNYAGAINNEATLAVTNSTLSASNGTLDGGGITNNGTLLLTASTISGNQAQSGGGLVAGNGSIVAVNTTIADNTADFGAGVQVYDSGTLAFYNTTVASNVVPLTQTENYGAAGVHFNNPNLATLELFNSLVANNIDLYAHGDFDCDGTLYTHRANLLGVVAVCDGQGCLPTGMETCPVIVGDGHYAQLNSPSTLGPLANNGGPTSTIALLPGSNAIDYGDPAAGCIDPASQPLAIDQRGFSRPAGVACDVGAFEAGAQDANDEIFDYGFE